MAISGIRRKAVDQVFFGNGARLEIVCYSISDTVDTKKSRI